VLRPRTRAIERGLAAAALVLVALGPLFLDRYWVSYVLTGSFVFGITAASLIFLNAYGGMVSLAQAALYGIAAFTLGNAVTQGESKGLHLGWNPWLGVVLAIVITTAVALLFGAIASRSTGIYFLMITLTYAVIATNFFGQVTIVSGFSGIGGIDSFTPDLVGSPTDQPNRLYYIALVVAVLVYAAIRYVVRAPFGIALQGIRDEPLRMSSLGYNVPLLRTLAFGLAGFFASLAGVLYGWWNGVIAPEAIGLSGTVDLLIMCVIGGLGRIEGAWVGAFTFIVINNYVRDVSLPLVGGSFNTIIGLVFLAIVIISPNGLMGVWDSVLRRVLGPRRGGSPQRPVEARATSG
jgi:branched-chain amino acid transport system permease protein